MTEQDKQAIQAIQIAINDLRTLIGPLTVSQGGADAVRQLNNIAQASNILAQSLDTSGDHKESKK